MVYDFEEGRILGEIGDLEKEIALIEAIKNQKEMSPLSAVFSIEVRTLQRTLTRLQHDKEHQIHRLQIHRQKVRDSGIKF